MLAFKAFNKDLKCTMGKGVYQFEIGKTYEEDASKCASTGFHCCEYPLHCFNYYSTKDRFCMVEAEGSIDEVEGDTKIACTKMTILKEISLKDMAGYAMRYMVLNPKKDWKICGGSIQVSDKAILAKNAQIAISRCKEPIVSAGKGAICGLIEEIDGEIKAARLYVVDGDKFLPSVKYTLNNGEIVRWNG